MPSPTETLVRRLIGGDREAAAEVSREAATAQSPLLLVAAALVADEPSRLLARAAEHATSARDRQLVVIAAAYLDGDHDRLDALVRDHLADHPDDLLAAWIASQPARPTSPPRPRTHR
jgi:hypothetical protein